MGYLSTGEISTHRRGLKGEPNLAPHSLDAYQVYETALHPVGGPWASCQGCDTPESLARSIPTKRGPQCGRAEASHGSRVSRLIPILLGVFYIQYSGIFTDAQQEIRPRKLLQKCLQTASPDPLPLAARNCRSGLQIPLLAHPSGRHRELTCKVHSGKGLPGRRGGVVVRLVRLQGPCFDS